MRYFIYSLAALLAVSPACAQEPNVRAYRLDGSLQCGMGKARTLAEDRQALEQLGAKLLIEEKGVVPAAMAPVCGAPTGAANTYTISAADWFKILRGFVGSLRIASWDPSPAIPSLMGSNRRADILPTVTHHRAQSMCRQEATAFPMEQDVFAVAANAITRCCSFNNGNHSGSLN